MLGKGATLDALGRTWRVSAPDQDAKDRLEKLAAAGALNEVRRLKGVLDPVAYQEAFSEVTKSLRDYRTWGPGWQRVVLQTAENVHLYLWALLQEHHPDVSEETVREIFAAAPEEVAAAYAQVMPDFFTLLLAPVRDRVPPAAMAELEAAIGSIPDRIRRSTPTNSA